ncbi:MAG: ATP-binding cassette domain-containing protein [Clostridia bacterium]|nr:ATP-binding cassette domain-containing protein [Clostridia bacterium]
MNAVEIRNLTKNFGAKQALNGLNMTVPEGAIYGFIGENGSGKSTTEKIICGLLHQSGGEVRLFGKEQTDVDVRAKMGVLIEAPGCFAGLTVWNNLMLQAENLSLPKPQEKVRDVLKLVRMEGAAGNKYKNCSLGMKQRIGIAMALLGEPALLVLDEPINGLDADGLRIMREVLTDVAKRGCTVIVSSHILGELEKVATHYGIVRGGKMIREMTAEELENSCRSFVALQAKDMARANALLRAKYVRVEEDEKGYLRVYDQVSVESVVEYLYRYGVVVSEVGTDKIGLEEYYIDLMQGEK